MLLIDELRAEYNKLETVMNDLEAIKSQVKKALENGQYIVYSHCQEQVKMSIKLDKEFDCLLENTELAIKTLVSTTNEVCGGNTFVTVDSTQVICVVKQFYPTDRLDLPFHKKLLLFYLRKPTALGRWEERCKFVTNQPWFAMYFCMVADDTSPILQAK